MADWKNLTCRSSGLMKWSSGKINKESPGKSTHIGQSLYRFSGIPGMNLCLQ
jgi:hypothetical protein